MSKLIELWVEFGIKVVTGYAIFVDKIGALGVIVLPFILLGFVIPWFIVCAVMLILDIIYGRIVYGLTFKEQFGWVKEGFMEGLGDHKNDING